MNAPIIQNSPIGQLYEVLYSQRERKTPLDVGFRGHPSIGAAVLTRTIPTCALWTNLTAKIKVEIGAGKTVKICIAGSIFGGTGAAGIPTIARLLRNAFQNQISIGGVFSLNGIDVGVDLSELQEKLGAPTAQENMGTYEIYSYANLKVEVRDNKVYALMTDSPGVKTAAGVQVGSSFDDIVSRHGSDFTQHFDKMMIYEYSKPALNNQVGSLIFSVDGSQDRVVNIIARLKEGSGPEAEQAKLALHKFTNTIARGESEIRKAYNDMLTNYYKATVPEEVFVKMCDQFSSLNFSKEFQVVHSNNPNSVILKFDADSRTRLEPTGTLYTPWKGEIEMVNEANVWKINSVKAERGESVVEK